MQLLPKRKITKVSVGLGIGVILLPFFALLIFFLAHHGRIFPNVILAGINVGGMTPIEAEQALKTNLTLPNNITLIPNDNPSEPHQISPSSFEASIDLKKSVSQAYNHGRSTKIKNDVITILTTLTKPAYYQAVVNVNSELLDQQLHAYAESVTNQPTYPSVSLVNKEIVVNKGELGTQIDIEELKTMIIRNLKSGNATPIEIDIKAVDKRLDDTQVLATKLRAQNMLDKEISFNFEWQTFTFDGTKLISFIDPFGGYMKDSVKTESENIAKAVNREAENPVFAFADGKVQEFKPSKDGVVTDQTALENLFMQALSDIEKGGASFSHTIPVSSSPPAISMDEVNNLGIKELIARGTSQFKGSIPSRVYNIQLAASRLNGILVKPGEEFSFNKTLGDISALSGYKPAYIIQGGRTVLGDGGGVCQVSTTLFRSLLNGGLPITERNQHSYRVGYYEQDSAAGLDAAIYTPTLDLKFKNDTPGHILIQTIADTTNMTLVFELYGTSDGRQSHISKPVVVSTGAPPEPQYIDDPTLPEGQIKQVDYAAWGARAQFDYKVTRNGETLIEKTFLSNYRPWQAKFLKGTGTAS